MIDAIRNWIINICTIIIFITAVEMLLPNNSIKKYVKYVLGLIMVIVLIKPIVFVSSGNIDINKYVKASDVYFGTDMYEKDYKKYKQENLENTIQNFKRNLELTLEKKLSVKYPNDEFDVMIDLSYDKDVGKFNIQRVEIGIKDKCVKRIKKINIGRNNSTSDKEVKYLYDDKSLKIKKFVSSELEVYTDIIYVYKNS
ncbi:stage III sporulation protein AF [Clostridium tepidiprofundi DSM 19306]|uniref:Stage III sporulation protein AF n=1 Tax=Clostridium tepidiprofundi DSM 19306 TaxID=1121338 RepID=A0A151B7C2_9CLOT|nr:stage III sporulation protein AF [Clostridium tepidiprofundi]KYH35690.1 stage III sporulation protein AF [Clostridium tepidiprofundi DSM 19306]